MFCHNIVIHNDDFLRNLTEKTITGAPVFNDISHMGVYILYNVTSTDGCN